MFSKNQVENETSLARKPDNKWTQKCLRTGSILYVLVYMYDHYYRVKNVGILLSYAFCWVLLKEHPYYVHYEPNLF